MNPETKNIQIVKTPLETCACDPLRPIPLDFTSSFKKVQKPPEILKFQDPAYVVPRESSDDQFTSVKAAEAWCRRVEAYVENFAA